MNLFHLHYVDWLASQLIYHAQPRVNVEGLNILAPSSPYVCIGYHQNVEQEVDLEYCRQMNIPVFRREVGGGAVFLDGKQIFFQLVMHRSHPLAQGNKEDFYRRMLEPVARTYQDLGIQAQYRPVNDIVTIGGRKISGTGVAEIDDHIVLVGNLIADFDYETMTRVLRVPDEKYRDKIFKSMKENLTTIRREAGRIPEWDAMAGPLIARFEEVLGRLEPSGLPQEVWARVEEIKPTFLSNDWLFMHRHRKKEPNVKIATGVNISQRVYKAPGGLLKATFEEKDGRLCQVSLAGDFFCYPRDAILDLERALEGVTKDGLEKILVEVYSKGGIDTPGVTPADWLRLLGGG
jgi:lipoate-protein ligase A